MSPAKLIVLVKAPRPATVKTRLARAIGPSAATAAYETLVVTLMTRLAELPEVELWFTPDEAEAEVAHWLRPGWEVRPQGDGDLGDRLQRAFAEAFAGGAGQVAVIGSDCPSVTAQDIRDAWAALATHDVVLGPARDGGYWLIGLNKPQPALFQRISWSTGAVLAETLDRARRSGASVRLLRELTDIDTEQDWREFDAAQRGRPVLR